VRIEVLQLICSWLLAHPILKSHLTQKTKMSLPLNLLVVVVYSEFLPTTTNQKDASTSLEASKFNIE